MKRYLRFILFASLFCPVQAYDQAFHAQLNKKLFSYIYEHRCWGSRESRSGRGSTLWQTERVRSELGTLLQTRGIKTLLDAPCGDFNWMRQVDLSSLESYIGVDIVAHLIKQNIKQYGNSIRQFIEKDIITEPLPEVDLILCRDCTQHLIDQDVCALFANIKKSGSRYLLTSIYPAIQKNKDIVKIYSTARITYRNLCLPPFNFPQPLYIIEEEFEGKALGLWEIASLPDFHIPETVT